MEKLKKMATECSIVWNDVQEWIWNKRNPV